jgi:two-component system response regulator MprA
VSRSGWFLVVDDDDDVREMIRLILDIHGYTAITAEHGLAALDQIHRRGRPQGVLLDLRMPRMSGQELAQALKGHPTLTAMPIIVISGDSHAFDAGEVPNAVAFLRKPIELDQLLEAVRRCSEPDPVPT